MPHLRAGGPEKPPLAGVPSGQRCLWGCPAFMDMSTAPGTCWFMAALSGVNGRLGGVRPHLLPPAQRRRPGGACRPEAAVARVGTRLSGPACCLVGAARQRRVVATWLRSLLAREVGACHVNGGLCFHSPQSCRSPVFCCRLFPASPAALWGGGPDPDHPCRRALPSVAAPVSPLGCPPLWGCGGSYFRSQKATWSWCCWPRPGRSLHPPVPPFPHQQMGRRPTTGTCEPLCIRP